MRRTTTAFVVPSFVTPKVSFSSSKLVQGERQRRWKFGKPLFVNWDSNDPLELLELNDESGPLTQEKLNNAFQRLAMQYYPSAVSQSTDDSSEDQQQAKERYDKLGKAYATLVAQLQQQPPPEEEEEEEQPSEEVVSSSTVSSSSSSKTMNDSKPSSLDPEMKKYVKKPKSYERIPPHRRGMQKYFDVQGNYIPPHRRKSSSSSSSSPSASSSTPSSRSTPSSSSSSYSPPSGSTQKYNPSSSSSSDWRDYMPPSEFDDYDTNGDSFSAILSDLLAGAAGAALSGALGGGAKGGGSDLISSLLGGGGALTQPSSSSNNVQQQQDAELSRLLSTGTIEQVGSEMDNVDLLVQQLSNKVSSLEKDLVMAKANLKEMTVTGKMASTNPYVEQITMEQDVAEQEARKKVTQRFLKQARNRLVALQTRYKQLITTTGRADSLTTGKSRSSTTDWTPPPTTTTPPPPTPPTTTTTATTTTPPTTEKDTPQQDDWKSEGFTSSGRGRGSRSRRSRRPTTMAADTSSGLAPSKQEAPPSAIAAPPPPQTSGDNESQQVDVDEEFDKLKRELGL